MATLNYLALYNYNSSKMPSEIITRDFLQNLYDEEQKARYNELVDTKVKELKSRVLVFAKESKEKRNIYYTIPIKGDYYNKDDGTLFINDIINKLKKIFVDVNIESKIQNNTVGIYIDWS